MTTPRPAATIALTIIAILLAFVAGRYSVDRYNVIVQSSDPGTIIRVDSATGKCWMLHRPSGSWQAITAPGEFNPFVRGN